VRLTLFAFALVACATTSPACNRDEPPPAATEVAPTAAATATSAPRDHLVPGELLEGPERAFGLALPRGSTVESSFPQQIIARCGAKASDVANFIRPRVSMGTVTVGAASTIFERVQVAANPGHELVIRVEDAPLGTGAQILVRDVTPPPIDPSLTEEQRWRQVGLSPGGGRIADPTHLH
jgi:hypothetical protein